MLTREEAVVTHPTDPREKCAQCGHSFSFHQKAFGKVCRAMGCKGGPDLMRCTGFVSATTKARLSQRA
jgi:hypothetical protein